jgi:PEP-CTERM motif
MKHCLLCWGIVLMLGGAVYAAPITPTITGPDINFGAQFTYTTNGAAPDRLVAGPSSGEEATAYWPNWPSTIGVQPIWYTGVTGGPVFGGDLRLDVVFTGHDETPPPLDVSLTGTGGTAGADLEIWGTMTPGAPNVLLWQIDLNQTANPNVPGRVSLYGYKDYPSYVLEAEGLITGGELAVAKNVVGQTGVMRGNIDLIDFVGFTARYDPASLVNHQIAGSYSGETGGGYGVPEPATIGLLVLGSLFGLWSRRSRRV